MAGHATIVLLVNPGVVYKEVGQFSSSGGLCTVCGTSGSNPNKQAQALNSGNTYDTNGGSAFCVNCASRQGQYKWRVMRRLCRWTIF